MSQQFRRARLGLKGKQDNYCNIEVTSLISKLQTQCTIAHASRVLFMIVYDLFLADIRESSSSTFKVVLK